MNCPIDGTSLTMTERQGIEIDYCPQCRGVWLDRGELDKIIERSTGGSNYGERRERDHDRDYDEDRDHRGRYHRPRRKRESFLEDLFDFG
jgi:uncharacterized protein